MDNYFSTDHTKGNNMNYQTYNKAKNMNYRTYNNNYRKVNTMNRDVFVHVPATHRCPVILVFDTSRSMWGKGLNDLKYFLHFFSTNSRANANCLV